MKKFVVSRNRMCSVRGLRRDPRRKEQEMKGTPGVYILKVARKEEPRVDQNPTKGRKNFARSELQSTSSGCPGYKPPPLRNGTINGPSHMQMK